MGDLQDARFAGTCEGKEFAFEGSGEFPAVGQINYTAKGSIWGNSIDIKCETSAGVVTMFGTQIGYIGPELFVVNDKPVTPA